MFPRRAVPGLPPPPMPVTGAGAAGGRGGSGLRGSPPRSGVPASSGGALPPPNNPSAQNCNYPLGSRWGRLGIRQRVPSQVALAQVRPAAPPRPPPPPAAEGPPPLPRGWDGVPRRQSHSLRPGWPASLGLAPPHTPPPPPARPWGLSYLSQRKPAPSPWTGLRPQQPELVFPRTTCSPPTLEPCCPHPTPQPR